MINWSLQYEPLIPLALWMIGAGFGLLLCLYGAMKGLKGWPFRFAALAFFLFALLGPYLNKETRKPLNTILLAAVDQSLSLHSTKRLALEAQIVKKLKTQLSSLKQVDVKWITIGSHETQKEFGTKAFRAINEAMADIAPSRFGGAVIITDGQIHDVPVTPPPAFVTSNQTLPLHAIIVGDKDEYDRSLKIIEAPRFGLVGKTVQYKIEMVEHGKRNIAAPGQLVVRTKDQAPKTYTLYPGKALNFKLPIANAGANIVELILKPVKQELTHVNNSAVLVTQGVREKLRVLLVSGEPHAGERTWRNLLKSDPGVDLVHFTILRPPEKQDGTPIHELSLIAFPTRELFSKKLNEFNLIIFDRYFRRNVLSLHYIDNIVNYVRAGGAVFFAAGDKFSSPLSLYNTPLADILPASPTGRILVKPFKPKLALDGYKHPVTRDLPQAGTLNSTPSWGHWARHMEGDKRRGNILMTGADKKPLLILDRVDKGRVALLLSDHAWLWARGYDGGGPHRQLLRRLAHWLMKEPDLEEDALFLHSHGRSLKIERRSMKKTVDPVVLEMPNGQTKIIPLTSKGPGHWEAGLSEQDYGLYRAHSGKLSASTHLGLTDTTEIRDLTATDKPLKPLVNQLNSTQVWAGPKTKLTHFPTLSMVRLGGASHGAGWLGFTDRKAYKVESIQKTDLMSGLLALALGLLLLGLMWWREGRD